MATKTTKKPARKKAARKKAAKRSPKRAKASPKAKAPAKPKTATPDAPTKAATPSRERDPRLPKPGAILRRVYQGKEYEVQVLDAGFLYDGTVWRSLSAIAKAISGTSWNGHLFWGTQRRAKAPAADAAKSGAQ